MEVYRRTGSLQLQDLFVFEGELFRVGQILPGTILATCPRRPGDFKITVNDPNQYVQLFTEQEAKDLTTVNTRV